MSEIAIDNNIGLSTLSRWLSSVKSVEKNSLNKKSVIGASITAVERFKHLQATSGQQSAMVGAYCRKHGLYPHQLTQWEADFMTSSTDPKNQQLTAELKKLRAENKALKQVVVRKDKVLAETVALLILKKKATQIWGEVEED